MLRLATCSAIALIGSTSADAAAPASPPPVAPPQAQTATAAAASAAAAAAASAPWLITFNVQVDLTKIDPGVTTAGLDCAANVTFQQSLTATGVTAGTVDAATYNRLFVIGTQSHPSRTAWAAIPLTNGEYHGVRTVTFQMPQADASFHTPTANVDTVIVGCRLLLNNQPAILNPDAALLLPANSSPRYVTSGAVALIQTRAIDWQAP